MPLQETIPSTLVVAPKPGVRQSWGQGTDHTPSNIELEGAAVLRAQRLTQPGIQHAFAAYDNGTFIYLQGREPSLLSKTFHGASQLLLLHPAACCNTHERLRSYQSRAILAFCRSDSSLYQQCDAQRLSLYQPRGPRRGFPLTGLLISKTYHAARVMPRSAPRAAALPRVR